MIQERVRAGLARARAQGKRLGRPRIDAKTEQRVAQVREQVKTSGRDPGKFGIEGWLRVDGPDPQRWAAAADGWRRLGADMVMLYPMYRISSFDDQIALLRRFKEVATG